MMQERKPVPVIIPYYKNSQDLSKCLAVIRDQTEIETEVFVRDNSEDNILYTRAVNEGLKKFSFSGKHDFILVLTQDAFLQKGALLELVNALEKNASAGIAAPIQITLSKQITWAGSLNAYP
jgi:GT2 family glycosyltransferase